MTSRILVTALATLISVSFTCVAADPVAAPGSGPPWRIVILHSSDSQLPASVQTDTAIRQTLAAGPEARMEVFHEELDTARFPPAELDAALVALLRKKHTARPPHVVIADSISALEFAEHHHDELWPAAVLIFTVVDERTIARTRLGHASTGVVAPFEFANTVELGLRLRPGTKRVVLIGGTSDVDRTLMEIARADMVRFAGRLDIAYMTDVSLAQALKQASELPPDSLLILVSLFRDGLGDTFVPMEAAAKIADASRVPTLTTFGTWIGTHALGGRAISFADQGREAAELALTIIAGADPRTLPVRRPAARCIVDWRELRHWQIPMDRVPDDCEVRYRVYSFWEQHWGKVLVTLAVILLQGILITILVLQHRQRRRAERESQQQHAQLAHAARLATVGELTASIAHEINQPLGAILSNADAAEILLEAPEPDLGEVRQILADIRRDDERASAVIQRLRSLLARHELDRQRLDPNTLVREAVSLMTQEADRRGVRVVENLGTSLPAVEGDRVHLVQVLLVLLINALDAMEERYSSNREVAISTGAADGGVEIVVRDGGPGIRPADFSRLFDSFFTTKANGMGLGLSIARSIIEAHGGKIWAENSTGGGAVFHIRLAAAP